MLARKVFLILETVSDDLANLSLSNLVELLYLFEGTVYLSTLQFDQCRMILNFIDRCLRRHIKCLLGMKT